MIVYFDNNIWSALTRLKNKSPEPFADVLHKIQQCKELLICFSTANVHETLERTSEMNRNTEMQLVNEITQKRFLDSGGSMKKRSIEDVIPEVKAKNEILRRLRLAFDMPKVVNRDNFDLSKEIQNNYPSDTAVDDVMENAFDKIQKKPRQDPKQDLDFIRENLQRIIGDMFRERVGQPNDEESYNSAMELIQNFLKTAFDGGLEISKRALEARDGNEFLKILLSANDSEAWRSPMVSGLLNAFQYWPDDKKVLERKGKTIDDIDNEHVMYASYCDYFVTQDRHLAKRYEAVLKKLKLHSKVVTFQEFITLLDSQSSVD